MASREEHDDNGVTRPTYVSVRVHGHIWPTFVPTADRIRMVDPSGSKCAPWVEWYWNSKLVGYGPDPEPE